MSIYFKIFVLHLGFAKAQSVTKNTHSWAPWSFSSSWEEMNKFQLVTDKAQKYETFYVDARQFKHDAHIGFSKSKSSGVAELHVMMGGWGGGRCVIKYGKYLVKTAETGVSYWNKIRSDFAITLIDRKITVMENSKHLMSYENPSIKKNDFKFLVVSALWGSSGQWKIHGTPKYWNIPYTSNLKFISRNQ